MKNEKEIIFLGRSLIALKKVLEYTPIKMVIVEDLPASDSVFNYCIKNGIECKRVKNSEEITIVASVFKDGIDLAVVSCFGYILRPQFIDKCCYVVNFHSGILPVCRGRHPLPSAIKYHHEYMGITAHIIEDGKIDRGGVVASLQIPINYEFDYTYNEALLSHNEAAMVDLVLFEYFNTGYLHAAALTSDGNYFPRMQPEELEKICHIEKLKYLWD